VPRKTASSWPSTVRASDLRGRGDGEESLHALLRVEGRLVVAFEPMTEVDVRVPVPAVEFVVGAGINLQGELVRRLWLHLHTAATRGRRPVVLLADEDQKRCVEPQEPYKAPGIEGDGRAEPIVAKS
jgi:hypothetical protein